MRARAERQSGGRQKIVYAASVVAMGLLLFAGQALSGDRLALAQERPKDDVPKPAATLLSATALRMGVALESVAPPPFLKWARSYSKREILKSKGPLEGAVAAALLRTYPQSPLVAREAGEFLLWYVAYQEGTEAQEIAAGRVRDIERDIDLLEGDLLHLRGTPVEISQMSAARVVEDRLVTRLQNAERMRDMHKRLRDHIGARVDVCIERLAALSESRKGRDPAEIRGLK